MFHAERTVCGRCLVCVKVLEDNRVWDTKIGGRLVTTLDPFNFNIRFGGIVDQDQFIMIDNVGFNFTSVTRCVAAAEPPNA